MEDEEGAEDAEVRSIITSPDGPRPQQLRSGRDFWQLYEKGETLGRGHFAKVQHQWFHMQAWLRPRSPTPMAVAKSHARHTPAVCAASLRSHPAWRTWTSRPTCLRRGARSAPGATTTHPPTPRPPRRAPSADPSLLPPTSAATAVNRLKNLVGAGSGRASGVDTDEEMATAAARTTISGE